MLADDLFHPDHVVPPAELVAAVFEGAAQGKPEVLMELRTVLCQVFVLHLRQPAEIKCFSGFFLLLHGLQPSASEYGRIFFVTNRSHIVFDF